jgi:hypothetical protein
MPDTAGVFEDMEAVWIMKRSMDRRVVHTSANEDFEIGKREGNESAF